MKKRKKSLDGKIIKIHKSLREAGRNVNGAAQGICLVALKKHNKKTYKGFLWEYLPSGLAQAIYDKETEKIREMTK